MNWPRLVICGGLCLALAEPTPPLRTHPLLVDDPTTLMALEERGFGFARIASSEALSVIRQTIASDIAELKSGAASDDPRRVFDADWITRGRLELVGIVNRIDRRAFDPKTCGEVRFVYRLALKNKRRPAARLPLTVNVRVPQGVPAGERDCRSVAARWTAGDLLGLLRDLPRFEKIEINLQSVHVPATRTDMDDHSEYILRTFRREGDSLVADTLFNTPREDLSEGDRAELLAWARANAKAIDEGTAVVPDRFLAKRVVSFSPRGLSRPENAVFSRALRGNGDAPPLSELALRRLDEMACPGCHQTTGVAGFHLLGQERDMRSVDALAIGRSPHLARDLVWRMGDLAAAARGDTGPRAPRPFAAHSEGGLGEECGLSKGLASWKCKEGLVCRDVHGTSIVGICSSPVGGGPGEPCEDVHSSPANRPEGALVTASPPDSACPAPKEYDDAPFCAPNWLGFTGGMCSQRCKVPGEIRSASARGGGDDQSSRSDQEGRTICARLPAMGYEADCLYSHEPIERCLERHLVTAYVQLCDTDHPCRGDYACAGVKGAPAETGACVPPYFLFQARVDGPLLDR